MKAELMTTFLHEASESIQINVGSHGSRVSTQFLFFFIAPEMKPEHRPCLVLPFMIAFRRF